MGFMSALQTGKELSMLIHMSFFFYQLICVISRSSHQRKERVKKSDKLLHCSVGVLSIEYSPCTCGVPRSVNWWTNSNGSSDFQNTFEIIGTDLKREIQRFEFHQKLNLKIKFKTLPNSNLAIYHFWNMYNKGKTILITSLLLEAFSNLPNISWNVEQFFLYS